MPVSTSQERDIADDRRYASHSSVDIQRRSFAAEDASFSGMFVTREMLDSQGHLLPIPVPLPRRRSSYSHLSNSDDDDQEGRDREILVDSSPISRTSRLDDDDDISTAESVSVRYARLSQRGARLATADPYPYPVSDFGAGLPASTPTISASPPPPPRRQTVLSIAAPRRPSSSSRSLKFLDHPHRQCLLRSDPAPPALSTSELSPSNWLASSRVADPRRASGTDSLGGNSVYFDAPSTPMTGTPKSGEMEGAQEVRSEMATVEPIPPRTATAFPDTLPFSGFSLEGGPPRSTTTSTRLRTDQHAAQPSTASSATTASYASAQAIEPSSTIRLLPSSSLPPRSASFLLAGSPFAGSGNSSPAATTNTSSSGGFDSGRSRGARASEDSRFSSELKFFERGRRSAMESGDQLESRTIPSTVNAGLSKVRLTLHSSSSGRVRN